MDASSIGFSNYDVSTHGGVKNNKTGYLFLNRQRPSGYITLCLNGDDGKRTNIIVHILVAKLFIPNPENKPTVDHIDRDRSNNKLNNLRWATYHEQNMNRSGVGNSRKGREVDQYTLEGDYVATWKSIKSIAEAFERNPTNLKHTLSGKRNSWHGYQWCYNDGDLPNEIWKQVPLEINNIYASTYGRVKKVGLNERFLYGMVEADYLRIGIRIKGKIIKFYAHHLICRAFHGLPTDDRIFVNHKNGIKLDNCPYNLEWVTSSENAQHARDNNLIKLPSHTKPISQHTMSGIFLKQYQSIAQAGRENKISNRRISNAIKNNNGVYVGFIWKLGNNEPKDKIKLKLILKDNIAEMSQ
ncbi:MAG TPA: HNH endonuclease [Candidatus Babeliales bacterium]|nr:HNH endonuclease [Candidatus Babeliales bacterium]